MIKTVETSSLDPRYERLRMRDQRREQLLLSSILEQGILDPLYVVTPADSGSLLLDGFKRYRCAVRLGIPEVPVAVLDSNEAMGILKLIRLSSSKGMSVLEEAGLVDELHRSHDMGAAEISRRLERSMAWVSVRLGMLSEMSMDVRDRIFSGRFPARSYMYTLRPFTRVNNQETRKDAALFVHCVSGRRFSTRDIDLLAGAWFRGGQTLKTQMQEGNLDWTLRQLKARAARANPPCGHLSEIEAGVLSNLEIVTAGLFKLNHGLKDTEVRDDDFWERGRRASGRLLSMLDGFKIRLQEFYDRSGQTSGGADALPGG